MSTRRPLECSSAECPAIRGPRRSAGLWATIVLALGVVLPPSADTAAAEPRHGLSIFGPLTYPSSFQHFSYASPDAPKGGRLSLVGPAGRIPFHHQLQVVDIKHGDAGKFPHLGIDVAGDGEIDQQQRPAVA